MIVKTGRSPCETAAAGLVGLAMLVAGPAGAGNAPEAVDWPPRPMNYTSHSEAFLRSLLAGRVWVFRQGIVRPEYRSVAAYVFFPDGRLSKCLGKKTTTGVEGWRPVRGGRWWVERQSIGTMFGQEDRSTKPRPYTTPMFYFPETGALNTETNSRKVNAVEKPTWVVLAQGWVQEGWPAAFTGPCAGLPLPEGMAVEERQTSLDWEAMRRQAPDAIVRHFPGSERTSPGRTGIGRSGGAPADPEDIERWLTSLEGAPLEHVSGRTVTVGPRVDGARAVHLLDEGGEAYREGRMSYLASGDIVIEVPGARSERIPAGYPLPFLPLADPGGRQSSGISNGQTSGSARCVGDYQGVATWTTSADGKRVWDISGCRPVAN